MIFHFGPKTIQSVLDNRCYSHPEIGRPKNGRAPGVSNADGASESGLSAPWSAVNLLPGWRMNKPIRSFEEHVPIIRRQSDSIGFGYVSLLSIWARWPPEVDSASTGCRPTCTISTAAIKPKDAKMKNGSE